MSTPAVRASRRYHEILARGGTADEADILADIERYWQERHRRMAAASQS